ncbi:CGNR zinc finger domain-containing protein [Actinomadura logoneensis]|uniref:CGNR zinc finger domain-containing protein n=1 Tax=Actinomadura logoneensis TaxID=2293572 RepID=A0A372JHN7_9ACTN|nr:CGNR zinc finger domain-containing protein [Actinomadura logoneensis]RFU39517.1 CGNR zinc finger domain-containing protein [Actinomadura logoneensis]
MKITGYRSHGVAAAVALVNAVTVPEGDAGPDALRRILRVNGFVWQDFDPATADEYRAWGRELRPFFEAPDLPSAVAVLNALLDRTPTNPHLSDHDGLGLHLHHAPPSAKLPLRFRSTTLMHLSELVCSYGIGRTGVCAAPDCLRVYADTSRAGRRRFCSETCANRTNVAAYRARRRSPTP